MENNFVTGTLDVESANGTTKKLRRRKSTATEIEGLERPLLLTIKAVARIISFSERKIRAMVSTGGFPAPVRKDGSVRWVRAEVDAWVENLREQR